MVGDTVTLYNRIFFICGCDTFTRTYYARNFGISDMPEFDGISVCICVCVCVCVCVRVTLFSVLILQQIYAGTHNYICSIHYMHMFVKIYICMCVYYTCIS